MWVAVTFAYLIPALVVTAHLLSDKRDHAVEIGLPSSSIAHNAFAVRFRGEH
jgi:hypothetical protein